MHDTVTLTPSAHRSIRWLDSHESAFAGELVTDGETMRVRVAAETLPDSLWRFAEAEHIVGVRDLVRTRTGHDVLLPWCMDPVDAFLGRRASTGQPLSTGEAVTLVGSLLRGVAEAADDPLSGRWWLTDDARPIFAPGEGGGCTVGAVQVISRVRDGCTDRMLDRMLAEISTALEDPRVVRRDRERWEHELTELAAPRPLQREVFAPARVSDIALHRDRAPDDALAVTQQHDWRERLRLRIAKMVVALHERMPRLRGLRPRAILGVPDPGGEAPQREAPRRGRMLLIGAVVAGVVLGAGLLWPPAGEDSVAVEEIPVATTPRAGQHEAQRDDSAAAAPKGSSPAPVKRAAEEPVSDDDPQVDSGVQKRVGRLLSRIAECGQEGDRECAQAVADGAGEIVLQRLEGAEADRSIAPIEDYGDIAVVRLGASGDVGEQMLVLAKTKSGWLVRDVYDVANQPSD